MDNGRRSAFKYRRLTSPRSIRVLMLEPSGTLNEPLQFKLKDIHLDTPFRLQYEALSYVWGARTGSRPVECDGATLLVTPSCETALRHLRLADGNRVLWVDAICIDQGEAEEAIKERNVQVTLMGEIYKAAVRTWCWLGEGSEFTKEVMFHLTKIGECSSQRGLVKLLKFENELHTAKRLDHEASCLDHLFCHPWHTRIWTVQEVVFSNECYVMCGHNVMPWSQYSEAATFLIYDQDIEHLDIQASRSMASIDMRTVLVDYLSEQEELNGQKDRSNDEDDFDRRITFLTSCLTEVNKLGASDPRDKIFALHAIFIDLGIPLPAVDYTSSITTVYTKAALVMIQWSGSLKVLRDACSLNRLASLPSWVPDWSDNEIRLYMPDMLSHLRTKLADTSQPILSPEPGRLRVCGKILGEIDGNASVFGLASFPTRPTDDFSPMSSTAKYYAVEDSAFLRLVVAQIIYHRELLRSIRSARIDLNNESPEWLFYSLLTHGTGEISWPLFEIWLNILQYPESKYGFLKGQILADQWKVADAERHIEWSKEVSQCSVIAASLWTASIDYNGQPLAAMPEIQDLVKTTSSNMNDQTVAPFRLHGLTTLTLGTTFRTAEPGNNLVWLQGADWPIVLRPAGAEWLFVGPAYLNGLKELLTDNESFENQCPCRDFVII